MDEDSQGEPESERSEHPLAETAADLNEQTERLAALAERMADVQAGMAEVSERLDGLEVSDEARERAGADAETERADDGLPAGDGPAAGIEDVVERLDGFETGEDTADGGDEGETDGG